MSIEEGSKGASTKAPRGSNLEGYCVPEAEIQEFVERLGLFDIEAAASRFVAVADATSRILEQRIERLNPVDLKVILRLATESKNRRYQRIMKAIVASVGQGPDGIKAAHLTAGLAVEISFKWTRDYVSAFKAFEEKLREHREVTEAGDSPDRMAALRLVSSSK